MTRSKHPLQNDTVRNPIDLWPRPSDSFLPKALPDGLVFGA